MKSQHRPQPQGELCLQTITMPKDANYQGDIFGGWAVSQMDLAGAVIGHKVANGKIATIAMNQVLFHLPIAIGSVVSSYAHVVKQGTSSLTIQVTLWSTSQESQNAQAECVAEALIVYVAIDENNRPRKLLQS